LSSTYNPWVFPLSAKYSNAFTISFLKRCIKKKKTEVKASSITSEKHPPISKE